MTDQHAPCPQCGLSFAHSRQLEAHLIDGCWGKPAKNPELVEKAEVADAVRSALKRQEGGSHYKSLAIQPVEYILKNCIPYAEGNVIKYVTRWRDKGGVEDLRKARHYLDLLIEHETANAG